MTQANAACCMFANGDNSLYLRDGIIIVDSLREQSAMKTEAFAMVVVPFPHFSHRSCTPNFR